jgi:hypothetical protein
LRAQPRQAQRRFVNQLQGQPRPDGSARLPSPATEKIPGSQAQVLGNEEPDADQVATDAVGQRLANAVFDGGGVAGTQTAAASGGRGLDGRDNAGTTFIEFFFAGRIRQ